MKNDTETNEYTTKQLFPMDVLVKGIKSINYFFDPETLSPWSNEVVEYNDVVKKIRLQGSYAPDEVNINDEQKFVHLVTIHRQLIEDYSVHAKSIKGFDKPIEIKLQHCALLIYLAKCWEDWGFKMHTMFIEKDKDAADRQLKYVYKQCVIPIYQESLELLSMMGEPLPPTISDNQKLAWGKMIVFSQSKFLTTLALYGNERTIKSWREHYKNGGDLLIKNGLGHLVPDYQPTPTIETDVFDSAKQLIWSAWQGMYGYLCGVEQPQYGHIMEQQEIGKPKVLTQSEAINREDQSHDSGDNNSVLRHRKGKPPVL